VKDQKRLGQDDLRVGGRYLHVNGSFVRTIDSIDGDTIRWHDQYGPGMCTTEAFLKVCHSFATDVPALETKPLSVATGPAQQSKGFTLRDEANALTAYAFRNGFLEDLHAGKDSPLLNDPALSRITDDEMQRFMIESSEKLAEMLRLKQDDPTEYDIFIRSYHWRFCRGWKRD
jgi:hypothetical protein